MKLNLGCGKLYLDGFKNIDISREVKADEYYDFQEGIMEEDNSCEGIHAGCSLEQISDNSKFTFVLNEIWRVLKPGGRLTGYVPSTDKQVLYLDPWDRRFFQVDTFKYFDGDDDLYRKFGRNYGFRPWKVLKCFKADNGIIHFEMVPYGK